MPEKLWEFSPKSMKAVRYHSLSSKVRGRPEGFFQRFPFTYTEHVCILLQGRKAISCGYI